MPRTSAGPLALSKGPGKARAAGADRQRLYFDGCPSVRRRIVAEAFALATKLNAARECPRCSRARPLALWPYEPSGGHRKKHCGDCVSPTAALDPAERRARNLARKVEYRRRYDVASGRAERRAMRLAARLAADAQLEADRAARTLHDAHVRRWKRTPAVEAAEYRNRYRTDPEFMLKERLRRQLRKKGEAVPGFQEIVRAAVKSGSPDNQTIERVTGYTVRDLRRHLERQFTGTMSWASWTKTGWHIDHILPKKCFDLTTLQGVRAYWALPNLRPLWSDANLRKSDRVEFLL